MGPSALLEAAVEWLGGLMGQLIALAVSDGRWDGLMDGHMGGGEEVLADRFARGEIDEDEFRRRRSALSG